MRSILSSIIRVLFQLNFFKKRHFGITVKIFKPYNIFKGVRKKVNYKGFQLELQLDDWIQENIYLLGDYESAELNTLKQFLNTDSVFLDIGANFGLFTLNAANSISESGKIISFEPFPKNFEALLRNVNSNNLNQVQLVKSAVGNENTTIELYLDEKENNLGSVSALPIENAIIEKVQSISIDSFLKDSSIKKIDFVKIDVEGFEYNVLLGMKETLKIHKPTLLIEIFNDENSENENNINSLLIDLGYSKLFIKDDGTLSKTPIQQERCNYIFTITER